MYVRHHVEMTSLIKCSKNNNFTACFCPSVKSTCRLCSGQVAAALGADAGPVLDQTSALPANHAGPLRLRSRHAAQQDQVGVGQTHQPGARGGGPHEKGGSKSASRGQRALPCWVLPLNCWEATTQPPVPNGSPPPCCSHISGQMLNEGAAIAAYSEQDALSYDAHPEMLESVMRDYTLLSCFKKDAHKMEILLKLLKCRQNDTYNCA